MLAAPATTVGLMCTAFPRVRATGDAFTAPNASCWRPGDSGASKAKDTWNHVSSSRRSITTPTTTPGSRTEARSAAISIDIHTQAAKALSSRSCGRMPVFPPLPFLIVSARTRQSPLLTSTPYALPSRRAVTMKFSVGSVKTVRLRSLAQPSKATDYSSSRGNTLAVTNP